jgi:outer membrane protein OmpA-like peptidoglycan-associated protein
MTIRRLAFVCIVSVALVSLGGCATGKSTIVLMPDHDGRTGAMHVETAGGSVFTSRAGEAVELRSASATPRVRGLMQESEIRAEFADVLRVEPLPAAVFILYFEMEAAEPKPESLAQIDDIVLEIERRDSFDIAINGHTDTTGDGVFNMDLSIRRARYIRDVLVERGANARYIAIDFHGEGDPLIPTADETPEPRNRRVEVIVR